MALSALSPAPRHAAEEMPMKDRRFLIALMLAWPLALVGCTSQDTTDRDVEIDAGTSALDVPATVELDTRVPPSDTIS